MALAKYRIDPSFRFHPSSRVASRQRLSRLNPALPSSVLGRFSGHRLGVSGNGCNVIPRIHLETHYGVIDRMPIS